MKSTKLKIAAFLALAMTTGFFFNNCSGAGGSSAGGAPSLVMVPIKISSGGVTVGLNKFNFETKAKPTGRSFAKLLQKLFLENANAAVIPYRVSPDKAKLRLTGFSLTSLEQNTDTSTESAFNLAQSCEIDYDKTISNQSFDCNVELQVGLHYTAIDFKVAPNVDVYINDGVNSIYTTAAGLTTSNPGAGLDYYTATYGSNTSFHADFPFQIDTTDIATTLQKITTQDGCANVIETKLLLSNGTVLSDVILTPGSPCGTPGTSSSTINIGQQNLTVVVDMIHGIQVDLNTGSLTVNTTVPWWTIVGTIGTNVAVKHYVNSSSGLTAATYQFPPSYTGINEVKVAYANGVAVAAQMVPNGYDGTFCHDDYDTPNNSPGNGYVGSDSNGAAWAVGPWSTTMTSYTSQYYLDTVGNMFYCKTISADPNPSPSQNLNTFSSNMPDITGWNVKAMTRID